MPLDSNSSKNENILPLLRAYRVSSSENLQEQIVEIYMGLIRETIATLPISLINQTRIGNQRSRDR
ncbi:MAG: RNA polymerase sigma factor SigF, partial [Pseudanabaena sp.]